MRVVICNHEIVVHFSQGYLNLHFGWHLTAECANVIDNSHLQNMVTGRHIQEQSTSTELGHIHVVKIANIVIRSVQVEFDSIANPDAIPSFVANVNCSSNPSLKL